MINSLFPRKARSLTALMAGTLLATTAQAKSGGHPAPARSGVVVAQQPARAGHAVVPPASARVSNGTVQARAVPVGNVAGPSGTPVRNVAGSEQPSSGRQTYPVGSRAPGLPALQRVAPVVFLPLFIWVPVIVPMPESGAVDWQDGESIIPDEQWMETTWDVNAQGNQLLMEVEGRVDLDYAEISFDDGSTQVVDFRNSRTQSGVYSLLDFREQRVVSSVKLVALAVSPKATVTIRLAE